MKTAKKQISRPIRETTTTWDFAGEKPGQVDTKEITVFFYSPTIADLKTRHRSIAGVAATEDSYWSSAWLPIYVHSLPDLNVGQGFAEPVTMEWLDDQDLENITRLRDAIDAAIAPKTTPVT